MGHHNVRRNQDKTLELKKMLTALKYELHLFYFGNAYENLEWIIYQ